MIKYPFCELRYHYLIVRNNIIEIKSGSLKRFICPYTINRVYYYLVISHILIK